MALLEIQNLKKYFNTAKGKLHAVDDVSLKVEEGTTIGVVGESGCGKSTLGRVIIHLQESTGGRIIFEGKDVTHVGTRGLRDIRSKMQIIFQDPYSSLNPRISVMDTIQEPLELTQKYKSREIMEKSIDLMELTGIDPRMRTAFPHELDGGRRQRVGIARALATDPKFVVCDEPVSALDVSIQAQILNLLQDIQEQRKLTYMFITHDMSVVKHIANVICVMYLGNVIEYCPAKELFANPLHPYTQALLSAIPSTDIDHPKKRIILRGEITSPINPRPGCRFAVRCRFATPECEQPQELREITPGHMCACCRYEQIAGEMTFNARAQE